MAPAPSPLFTGSPPPPSVPLSLHLLSTVTMASASADSDMDTPIGDESPPSDPPPASSVPSPPPPSPPTKPQSAPSAPPSRPMPVREDCWSEEATATLIEAWGDRYVELNKGNLRQKHWQEVADAVNAAHGHTKKTRRSDIQCKNRIDTIKKKYKIEKARTVESRGAYVSPWPFFSRLDSLIGDTAVKKFSTSPAAAATSSADLFRKKSAAPSPTPCRPLALTSHVPVGPRSLKPKRPAAMDDSFFRRTFAAAAAAASESDDEDGENEREEPETSRSSGAGSRRRGWRKDGGGSGNGSGSGDGCRQLAEAIMRFGEIYERVEGMKQDQMIELEKHRMQFAKELEFQRMKLLMETQLKLAKIKRMKPSNDADADSY